MSDVTRLLEAAERGEKGAADQLLDLVYVELHNLARQKLAGEAPGQTLQPTALVHDVWLQLLGGDAPPAFADRSHFFRAAALAMRRMLIDRARRRRAEKRGGGADHVDLDSIDVAANADDETLLLIDDAMEKLAREEPPAAELVRLRFFVGLRIEEAAEVLQISERTAKRQWTFARVWLYDELQRQSRA